MFYAQKYEVKSGDNLTSIAKKFGLPSWKNIYDAPENGSLKLMRGSPNNLHVGDVLSIPPNPVLILEYQLNRLMKLRTDTDTMYENLMYQTKKDYQEVKRVAYNADLAAAVTQLGIGYAKIMKGGVDAMKLTGKELAKANQQLAKSAVTNGPKFAIEQGIQQSSFLEVTGEEGLVLAFSKIVVKSWFDMTSPSYWAQRISGVNIEQLHRETTYNLNRQRNESIRELDKKIYEIRESILKLKSENNVEIQLH